jgi:hypothetical protein
VNCWVVPGGIDGLAGVTLIEINCTGFTVSVVLPEILPEVAVISVEPALALPAKPAALTVATVGTEELHVAVEVKFCWVPLL